MTSGDVEAIIDTQPHREADPRMGRAPTTLSPDVAVQQITGKTRLYESVSPVVGSGGDVGMALETICANPEVKHGCGPEVTLCHPIHLHRTLDGVVAGIKPTLSA